MRLPHVSVISDARKSRRLAKKKGIFVTVVMNIWEACCLNCPMQQSFNEPDFIVADEKLILHLRRGKVWLGHLVATLHHLVEPGVHCHAGVGALA